MKTRFLSLIFVIGLIAIASLARAGEGPRVPQHYRLSCPYDDFLNEEIQMEIHVYAPEVVHIEGRFSGPTVDYDFVVTADAFAANLDAATGGLTHLSFRGLDQNGTALGFDFDFSTPYQSGIGHSASEVIGNRVFICSQD